MCIDGGHRRKPIDFHIGHIGFFGFRTLTLVCLWIPTPNFSGTILLYMGRSRLIFSNVIFKMAAWRPYWFFRFLDSEGGMVSGVLSQVCFRVSILNFICILMVVIGKSILIFSDFTSKMAAWRPFCIFGFQTLTFVWLWKSTPNYSGTVLMYMDRTYWFTAMLKSKWPPGSHIDFFGFQTLTLVWLWIWTRNFNGQILVYMSRSLLILWPHFQNGRLAAILVFSVSGLWRRQGFWSVKSSLLWSFNLKFHMHIDGGHRQEPIDFRWLHFQNGRLAAILHFLVSKL